MQFDVKQERGKAREVTYTDKETGRNVMRPFSLNYSARNKYPTGKKASK